MCQLCQIAATEWAGLMSSATCTSFKAQLGGDTVFVHLWSVPLTRIGSCTSCLRRTANLQVVFEGVLLPKPVIGPTLMPGQSQVLCGHCASILIDDWKKSE